VTTGQPPHPLSSRASAAAAAATGAGLVAAVVAELVPAAGGRPPSILAARAGAAAAELVRLHAAGELSKLESLASRLGARRRSRPGDVPSFAWLHPGPLRRVRVGLAVVEAAGLPWCGPWRQVWPLELVGRMIERVPGPGCVGELVELLEDVSSAHLERGEAAGRALVQQRRRDAGAREELGADELARELAACVRRCRAGRVCGWDVVREAIEAVGQAAEVRAREEPLSRGAS